MLTLGDARAESWSVSGLVELFDACYILRSGL